VNGDLDIIFFDQLFQQGIIFFLRFSYYCPYTHLPGKIKDLSHLAFRSASINYTISNDFNPDSPEFFLNHLDVLITKLVIENNTGRQFFRNSLARIGLDIAQAKSLCPVQGFEKSITPVSPALHGDRERFNPYLVIIRFPDCLFYRVWNNFFFRWGLGESGRQA